ncbi:MAG: DUF971 domain-containing protein [Anaerolineae bacterium]|jgi:DUF971 family protein|uniref:DUF971 domain-containing protein n=1 Tax=Candidatus Flexifilum breve TaxID=3140694 RepID=UPI001AC95AA5|nr:DUF971 domain-containing protein [Chloroflexota bacterium]MBK9750486.1 DUF971 domain-containing protein [Chloroflexota bacterium]MBN8637317.1 DUF971 domain-containing protein [Anaerolineae bacterium]
MTNALKPRSVTLNKTEGFLEIIWGDDQLCRYPLSELREACPCVECRGGHQYMGRQYDPDDILMLTPKRTYTIQNIELVGNYALLPTWDDGHHTGIYTWEYLRRLCPTADAK